MQLLDELQMLLKFDIFNEFNNQLTKRAALCESKRSEAAVLCPPIW